VKTFSRSTVACAVEVLLIILHNRALLSSPLLSSPLLSCALPLLSECAAETLSDVLLALTRRVTPGL
jgi:hypothetical protein